MLRLLVQAACRRHGEAYFGAKQATNFMEPATAGKLHRDRFGIGSNIGSTRSNAGVIGGLAYLDPAFNSNAN